jgi:tetratricopeptide (TPR) repeat protein
MAVNKAKILKTAEKFVVQGKIQNAIAEYQKLIKEDPTDLPLVNSLGDLYVRVGNTSEAVKCFSRLAESYDNGGFIVRAIAMYKKVAKTDPTQVVSLSRLADLYLRQGLVSEARSHYLQVVESYIKRGALEEAALTLKKIIEADPENPVVEERLAEVYQHLGQTAEAVAAFHSAAIKLMRKGQYGPAEQCLKKIQSIDSQNLPATISYAEVLGEQGRTDEALEVLNKLPFADFNSEVMETVFNIYLRAGRLAEAEKTASHAIEVDNSHFKMRLPLAKAYAETGDFNHAVVQVSKITRLAIERGEGPLVESELKAILRRSPESIPALMELVKYYNHSNEPHNVPTYLEKIGTIFVRNEQLEEAAKIYLELIRLEPNEPSHRESLSSLKEHGVDVEIPPLPPMGSAGWGPTGAARPEFSPLENLITEGDLFAGYGQFAHAIEQFRKVLEIEPNNLEAHQKILEMCDKLGDFQQAATICLNLYSIFTMLGQPDEAAHYFERASRYNPDIHHQTATAPQVSGTGSSDEELQDHLRGLLEEADFYLDQSFVSEARRCLQQCADIAPNDPDVQRRFRRLQALKEKSPGPARAAEPHEGTLDLSGEMTVEGLESTSHAIPMGAGAEIQTMPELESHSYAAPPPVSPVTSPPPAPVEQAPKSNETSFADLMDDLDAEMHGAAQLEEPPVEVPPALRSDSILHQGESQGLHEVFEEFRAEFEEGDEGEAVDFETHYNLGTAFKEMGLMEEAIGEFQKALQDKSLQESNENYLRCCNLLALCFLEQRLPQVAIKWFKKALASPGHPEETYLALRYDLGCAHGMAGDKKAAMETFLDIYGTNINYRDVSEKIDELKREQ